jgi:hypothetical protein
MPIQVPPALKVEHDELHAELKRAIKAGGRTGEAASAVAKLMHPHFVSEEEFALPPLGLLSELSRGRVESGMAEVLKLTDKLEAELPRMLAEHQEIVIALRHLAEAARAENKPEIVAFSEKLIAHAQAEEQVAYPASLLIGRYLRAALPAPEANAA